MNQPDYLFLIGGSDLEMATIKRLLTDYGFSESKNIADQHLRWRAKLIDYQSLFDYYISFIDIALTRNIPNLQTILDIDFYKGSISKAPSVKQ